MSWQKNDGGPSVAGFVAIGLFVMLCLAAVAQVAWYYPRLPNQVASHFDLRGRPDDWSSKESLLGVYLGVWLPLAAVMLAVALLVPRLPSWMVSLPNKDYWFAPERKAQTCRFFTWYFLVFTDATMALLLVVMQGTLSLNVGEVANLGPWFLAALICYGVFTALWCAGLVWRFRRPVEGRRTDRARR